LCVSSAAAEEKKRLSFQFASQKQPTTHHNSLVESETVPRAFFLSRFTRSLL
jgi:hypothetical protein